MCQRVWFCEATALNVQTGSLGGRERRHEASGLQTGGFHLTCQGVPPCVTRQAIPVVHVGIVKRMLSLLQDGVSLLARASAILELDQ